ncbi:uncharacterized protein LOC114661822 isoform X2 [Erpetoichthys calabaricus]|nr:uncharacterized protein LOC114661822 isoform X2 [Erpetoichthys calabaricus]
MGESNPLECHADGFYPEEIFFEWLRDSRVLHHPVPSQMQKNSDGTFSAVSLFFYTPTNNDTGVLFCCRVKHNSQHEPLEENFLLKFRRRPSVTITPTTLLQGEEQAIMCKVDGYYPDDIIVAWRRNGKPLKKIEEKSDGTFAVSESFMVTPKGKEEEQETFSCEVKQEGFAEPLTKNIQFKIEGKPRSAAEVIGITIAVILVILLVLAFLFYRLYKKYHKRSFFMSDIIVPSKVFVGQEVTLECFIDRHFREEPTWWIKVSDEWGKISCNQVYVIKNTVCKSSILHRNLQNGNGEEQSLIKTQRPQKRHTTLTFVTDVKKHADVAFRCQITGILPNLKKEETKTKETKLRLLAYPSISAIKDISVFPNENGMLWIKASDFYPKEIRFKWPDSVSSETQSASVDKHGLYSTYSQCKVPMEHLRDPEFELQVDIIHDSLEFPCTKRIRGGIPGIGGIPLVSNVKVTSHLEIGHPCTLSCNVTEFYFSCRPEIKWIQKRISTEEIVTREEEYWKPVESFSGPFKKVNSISYLVAQAVFVPTRANIQDMDFICRVEHPLLSTPIERHTQQLSAIGSICKPNVSKLKIMLLSKTYMLTCTISDFYPNDIKVTWWVQEKDTEAILIENGPKWKINVLNKTPYRKPNNLYTLIAQAEFTPRIFDLTEHKIICRVEHESINQYVERTSDILNASSEFADFQAHYETVISYSLP